MNIKQFLLIFFSVNIMICKAVRTMNVSEICENGKIKKVKKTSRPIKTGNLLLNQAAVEALKKTPDKKPKK